jgi:hypothetical protein
MFIFFILMIPTFQLKIGGKSTENDKLLKKIYKFY